MPSLSDSIVLGAGSPMSERLQSAARRWVENGRTSDLLLSGVALFMAQCWLYSSGNYDPQSPGFRQDVSDFVAASKTALGGEAGWNALLSQKDSCCECQMTFRLENLGICTACAGYVCGACRSAHGCAAEIVG